MHAGHRGASLLPSLLLLLLRLRLIVVMVPLECMLFSVRFLRLLCVGQEERLGVGVPHGPRQATNMAVKAALRLK